MLQIEFYFSDSNVPRDKFLREKIAESAEASHFSGLPAPSPSASLRLWWIVDDLDFDLSTGQCQHPCTRCPGPEGLPYTIILVAKFSDVSCAQGFVDLDLLCTFSRMTEALGIPKKGKDAKVEVDPQIISQVRHLL